MNFEKFVKSFRWDLAMRKNPKGGLECPSYREGVKCKYLALCKGSIKTLKDLRRHLGNEFTSRTCREVARRTFFREYRDGEIDIEGKNINGTQTCAAAVVVRKQTQEWDDGASTVPTSDRNDREDCDTDSDTEDERNLAEQEEATTEAGLLDDYYSAVYGGDDDNEEEDVLSVMSAEDDDCWLERNRDSCHELGTIDTTITTTNAAAPPEKQTGEDPASTGKSRGEARGHQDSRPREERVRRSARNKAKNIKEFCDNGNSRIEETTPETAETPASTAGQDNTCGTSSEYDTSLFERFCQAKQDGSFDRQWTPLEVQQLKLFRMLTEARAPLYLYDKIADWAHTNYLCGLYEGGATMESRDKFVNTMRKRQDQERHVPITEDVCLPYSKKRVRFTRFDFKEALYSLLTDKELMKEEHLMFRGDKENPIVPPIAKADLTTGEVDFPPDHVFADLLSGKVATMAHKLLVKVEGRDVDTMVIWFLDKTHLDTHGRNQVEPLRFTLGIFNGAARRRPKWWRTLAFIPNSTQYKNDKLDGTDNNLDYQFLLRKSLRSYHEFARRGGVYWEVQFGGRKLPLVMKLYSGMLQGDTEGHLKAVGHKGSAGAKNKKDKTKHRPCRRCNTPYTELANWDYPFQLTKRCDIEDKEGVRKRTAEDSGYRFKKGMKDYYSAFERLDGDKNVIHKMNRGQGMMGSIGTPQDTLHGMSERKRAIDGFRTQRKRQKLCQKEGGESNKKSGANKKQFLLFASAWKEMCEGALNVWGVSFQHQSDRTLPRTNFRVGALSTEKINANEQPGLLMLYLTLMCSFLGEFLFGEKQTKAYKCIGGLGDDRVGDWVNALDSMLLCERFTKSEEIPMDELMLFDRHLPLYLDSVSDAIQRGEGDGMKLPKVHGRRHSTMDITNYGSALHHDSEVGELSHIEGAKRFSDQTQKRAEVLDEQQAKLYAAGVTADACYNSYQADAVTFIGTGKRRKQPILQGKSFLMINSKIHYTRGQTNGGETHMEANWKFYNNEKKGVEKLLAKTVLPLCGTDRLQLFNSYHPRNEDGMTTGVIYRAEPCRRTTTKHRHDIGWLDWAVVQVEDDGEPAEVAQIVCFLELPRVAEDCWDEHTGSRLERCDRSRACAVITRSDGVIDKNTGQVQNPVLADDSQLVHRVTKRYKGAVHSAHRNLLYAVVPANRIKGPCTCVPDILPESGGQTDQRYKVGTNIQVSKVDFFYFPPEICWKDLFVTKMRQEIARLEDNGAPKVDSAQAIRERTNARRRKQEKWEAEHRKRSAKNKKDKDSSNSEEEATESEEDSSDEDGET